jgi:hypothetical protein
LACKTLKICKKENFAKPLAAKNDAESYEGWLASFLGISGQHLCADITSDAIDLFRLNIAD